MIFFLNPTLAPSAPPRFSAQPPRLGQAGYTPVMKASEGFPIRLYNKVNTNIAKIKFAITVPTDYSRPNYKFIL